MLIKLSRLYLYALAHVNSPQYEAKKKRGHAFKWKEGEIHKWMEGEKGKRK